MSEEVVRLHRNNYVYVTFVITDDEVTLATLDDYSRDEPIILFEDFGKSREAILEEYSLYGFEPYQG
jgi:hypothetical protein